MTDTAPTKANLLQAKKTLDLSRRGYGLLDKKRTVLIHETYSLTAQTVALREKISILLTRAYSALQSAVMEMGRVHVASVSQSIPLDTSVKILFRNIMGVEIPVVVYKDTMDKALVYDLNTTTASLDEAYFCFNELKDLLITLAEVENAARSLAEHIRKTNKRANALKNIAIPQYETQIKLIQDSLEERERDAFARLKMVKKLPQNQL
jgi:V/A-type H+-transporting ATPase subunit D